MKRKYNSGITLLSLSIYIIALLLVIGILTSIRTFFNNNLKLVEENGKYATAFEKFNLYFVRDINNNSNVKISTSTENKTITFEDGNIYTYKISDKTLYRNRIKISNNITGFNIEKKDIVINNVKKIIISVNMIIGDSSISLFNKSIDYTLKYW